MWLCVSRRLSLSSSNSANASLVLNNGSRCRGYSRRANRYLIARPRESPEARTIPAQPCACFPGPVHFFLPAIATAFSPPSRLSPAPACYGLQDVRASFAAVIGGLSTLQ
jgi:hypothetical protein